MVAFNPTWGFIAFNIILVYGFMVLLYYKFIINLNLFTKYLLTHTTKNLST